MEHVTALFLRGRQVPPVTDEDAGTVTGFELDVILDDRDVGKIDHRIFAA